MLQRVNMQENKHRREMHEGNWTHENGLRSWFLEKNAETTREQMCEVGERGVKGRLAAKVRENGRESMRIERKSGKQKQVRANYSNTN